MAKKYVIAIRPLLHNTCPSILGVYESQVPLIWRAIMELGCVCIVNPKVALNRGSKGTDKFSLDDFDFKNTTECPYLSTHTLHNVFLYHNQSPRGDRGMFCLFFPHRYGISQSVVMRPGLLLSYFFLA
jgi:hypothetical protein